MRIRKKKSLKVDGVEWWHVETRDRHDHGGYIKKSDLTGLNAHDFKDFGWQLIEDAGTNYFYMFGKYVEEKAPKPLVQKIWDAIGNGNKSYTVHELRQAMADEVNKETLGRIIFKHPSEWAMKDKIGAFKDEYIKVCEKGINEAKGTDEGETETRKDKLARTRDERLALVTDKIEKLSFWGDIKNGDLLTKPQRKEAYFKSKGVDTGEVGLGGGSAKKAAQQKEANEGFDKLEAKRAERFFPKDDTVYHLHPVGFVQHMKVICAPRYNPDHGDFHDPIVNPQVRGWYGSTGHNPNSDVAYWNPYGSMKSHGDVDHLLSHEVKVYGKNQRGGNTHNGVDLYAPVGTPVYASVDGKITMHEITKSSSGFKIKLEGRYKEEHIRFNYIHLMQFEKTRFRFFNQNSGGVIGANYGWLNYADYTTPDEYTDPKKGEVYKIHYNNGILKIDQNEIDVDLALNIKQEYDSNIKNLKVKKGQIIGYTGSTGNSYQGKKQNHLHYNTYVNWKGIQPTVLFKDYMNIDIEGTETNSKQDGKTSSGKW